MALWLLGRRPQGLTGRFFVILALGGLQGAVGWWMVQSGLSERVDVSQYRLAAHLGLAFVLFGALIWAFADVWDPAGRTRRLRGLGFWAGLFALAVFVQIILGAFVAGLDAGRIHTDWPLMDGGLAPRDYGALSPWWRDAFENRASVQFHHRLGGYALVMAAAVLTWACWRRGGTLRHLGAALGAVTVAQMVLGVVTLVHAAPLVLSAAHQGVAAVLLALALVVARAARPASVGDDTSAALTAPPAEVDANPTPPAPASGYPAQ